METTDPPPAAPATNDGTAPPPQPSPAAAGLVEKLGLSHEQLAQVFAVIKSRFKQLGWDLDAKPPDDSKWPGSEEMFWLFLSAMHALDRQNPWEYQSKLRQMDKQIRRALVPLGNRLAQPPPHAIERLELTAKVQAQVDQQLAELSRRDLTPTERVRLLELLRKRERAFRQRTEDFYGAAVKAVTKRKTKPR